VRRPAIPNPLLARGHDAALRARRTPASAVPMALAALVGLAGLAPAALAGDGVLEINQVCATQTGCFAGDAPGFPITIAASGSYRLTSNVSLTDPNANGIEIGTSFVNIDLGGFLLAGPITCTGSGFNQSLVCGAGTGDGIWAANNDGIAVRNGTLRGFADQGFAANGDAARVEDMSFSENGRWSVQVSGGALIRNVLVERSGGNGTSNALVAGTGAVVENLVARQNQNGGASVGSFSTIRGSSFTSNGANGLSTGSGCTVVQNSASSNGGDGISVSKNSQIAENSSTLNDGDGIQTTSDSNVQRNTVAENAGYGLRITGAGTAYRENQIGTNTLGTVLGGVNTGSNLCNGSGICP
jgi:hypothetical protein